jgi:hypothetical protein
MYAENCGEIEVCQDCLILHANGETSPDFPADSPQPLSAIPFGYDVTMGGDETGFSWQSCEGCGSNLGGDRFEMTLWRLTTDEARERFNLMISLARRNTANRDRVRNLAVAGQFRAYLAARFAEQRAAVVV